MTPSDLVYYTHRKDILIFWSRITKRMLWLPICTPWLKASSWVWRGLFPTTAFSTRPICATRYIWLQAGVVFLSCCRYYIWWRVCLLLWMDFTFFLLSLHFCLFACTLFHLSPVLECVSVHNLILLFRSFERFLDRSRMRTRQKCASCMRTAVKWTRPCELLSMTCITTCLIDLRWLISLNTR